MRIVRALDALRDFYESQSKQDLAVAKRRLIECRQNSMVADAANDLLRFMQKGIVVTDINLGNWGIMPRRPKALTLIDPGHVVYLTAKAKSIASDIPSL